MMVFTSHEGLMYCPGCPGPGLWFGRALGLRSEGLPNALGCHACGYKFYWNPGDRIVCVPPEGDGP